MARHPINWRKAETLSEGKLAKRSPICEMSCKKNSNQMLIKAGILVIFEVYFCLDTGLNEKYFLGIALI
jgi:hypothetical protein